VRLAYKCPRSRGDFGTDSNPSGCSMLLPMLLQSDINIEKYRFLIKFENTCRIIVTSRQVVSLNTWREYMEFLP
jgi:hypothetical protein